MHIFIYILTVFIFLLMPSPRLQAEVYKWVDDKGTVHFSDKPYSDNAETFDINPTGIKLHGDGKSPADKLPASGTSLNHQNSQQDNNDAAPPAPGKAPVKKTKENDSPYRFRTSVSEIGADIIRVSGRVSSGPACDNLKITARVSTDTELSATVSDVVRKPNSFGSVVFEGNAKVAGSSEDYGFWDIDSTQAVCLDQK